MSYKLGSIPSESASTCEIADFLEVECLKSDTSSVSIVEAANKLGILTDDNEDDIEDSDIISSLQRSLDEIDNRLYDTHSKYPFRTDVNTIYIEGKSSPYLKDIYTFLLLVTRENMNDGRLINNIDGTKLFENLCCCVIKNYFGNNASSFVFGTGANKSVSFYDRISDFLNKVQVRGYQVHKPQGDIGHHQDGGVDIIAFIPFHDNNQGQFFALGQCKTGQSWQNSIVPPYAFVDNYISPSTVFKPVIFYMVSESFSDSWTETARQCCGLLFDRERIMEYIPEENLLPLNLLDKIREWNRGVLGRYTNN